MGKFLAFGKIILKHPFQRYPIMKVEQKSEYFAFERSDVKPFLPTHYRRVLEIGCGEGRFSQHLHSAQEYWGIEPDFEASRISADRMSQALCGTFESRYAELPDDYFDLVICNDVIEHMPDHSWFLDRIKTKMTRKGLLVGSVPNVRYITNLVDLLVRRDWPYTNSGVLDRTHLRFFTEKSLSRSFLENGFAIEALQGINSVFRLPKSIMNTAKSAVALCVIAGTLVL